MVGKRAGGATTGCRKGEPNRTPNRMFPPELFRDTASPSREASRFGQRREYDGPDNLRRNKDRASPGCGQSQNANGVVAATDRECAEHLSKRDRQDGDEEKEDESRFLRGLFRRTRHREPGRQPRRPEATGASRSAEAVANSRNDSASIELPVDGRITGKISQTERLSS